MTRLLPAVTLVITTPLAAYGIAETAGGALTWGEFALIALAGIWAVGQLRFRRSPRKRPA